RDLMLTTGQRTASERVVSFLLACSHRNERKGNDPAVLELPITRTAIGDFLCLTVETLCRTITKLSGMGLIDPPPSSEVKLLDTDALKRRANGNDQHL